MTALGEELRSQKSAIEARYGTLLQVDRRARVINGALAAAAIGLFLFGLVFLDISPTRLWLGMGRLFDITGLMLPPVPGRWERTWVYLGALGQTLSIALLGTLTAAVLALPAAFLAARTVVANRLLHALTRRSLDTIRSIDTLIWALIWINVVGLGPFAGALAIASSDFGALAKLMSETIESADRRPGEGVLASGGSPLSVLRFGVWPQILPVFASQLLYFFESNVRSATIIGIVGAGGIGLHLYEQIRILEWQESAFIILIVLVSVALIDAVSQRLRGVIMGDRSR